MKTSAADVLLLVAAAPYHFAAQTHESSQSAEKAKQNPATGSSQKREESPNLTPIPSSMVLESDVKFQGYEVRTYRADTEGHPLQAFEILQAGHRIFSRADDDGLKYRIGCVNTDDRGNQAISPGKDITGAGKPNLVISDWTGGAHCCFTYYVFALDDEVREVGRIYAEDGDICRFQEEPGGKVDFIVYDWNFAYWNASFAASPAPEIILRYQPGGYRVATDRMATARPSSQQFQQLVAKGRDIPLADNGWPESDYWGMMLDLIYSGHADLAWKFCDESWPGSAKAKTQFLQSFRSQLFKSPYWGAVKAMNGC